MLEIQENVKLNNYTTFRVGGSARYFIVVKNTADLEKVADFVRERCVPFFILGGGANLLVNDGGYAGLVIKNEIKGKEIIEVSENKVLLRVGAGEDWDETVEFAVENGFGGLENLSGIPGTVGASPVQNIGAYGAEVKDCIVSVDVFNLETGRGEVYYNQECEFAYRWSIFKKSGNKKFVITAVTFDLKKDNKANIVYKDLQKYFSDRKIAKPSIKEVREAVLVIRGEKLPDLKTFGCGGSFFKNPIVEESVCVELVEKYPGLPAYNEMDGRKKISLAWILDRVCGLKGYREGAVGLYEKQPLILVNHGGANAGQIKAFAEKIAQIVREKTGVEVEWEVELV
ncbi:MAG: UDP-N-acetylmuramate dehydrogenase [bacterium]